MPVVDAVRLALSGNVAVTVLGVDCAKMGFFGSSGPRAQGRQCRCKRCALGCDPVLPVSPFWPFWESLLPLERGTSGGNSEDDATKGSAVAGVNVSELCGYSHANNRLCKGNATEMI